MRIKPINCPNCKNLVRGMHGKPVIEKINNKPVETRFDFTCPHCKKKFSIKK